MLSIIAWVFFIPAFLWWLILHGIVFMAYLGPDFKMAKDGVYSIIYSWVMILIPGIYLFGI